MANYYYAVAALPMLAYDAEPVMSSEEFLSFCKEQCSQKDFDILEQAALSLGVGDSGLPFLARWQAWERSLRNELVKIRAEDKGVDATEYFQGDETVFGLPELVKNAAAASDPLEAEKKLYEARWNFLDELGTNIFFKLETLLIYYLKLQILEKLSQFQEEAGRENFNSIYTAIREGADRESGVNP